MAVFGSFYRGFHVLSELLKGPLARQVTVVGVATDLVGASPRADAKRVWAYAHRPEEEGMVEQLARAHGVPCFKGPVKTDEFRKIYREQWQPELCIAATFGQRFDEPLFDYPRLGFYNLHPCVDDGWPSFYAGPNPFQALLDNGQDHAVVALHAVDNGFDTGNLLGLSEKIYFAPGSTVVDLHKATSPVAAKFFAAELAKMLAAQGVNPCIVGP